MTEIEGKIEEVVAEVLGLKDANTDTTALEAKIDQLVFGLYGVSEEEIAIIET